MRTFGTYRIDAFGRLSDGTEVQKISLAAPSGMTLEVLTLGATIHRLLVPTSAGPVDVVLGKPSLDAYRNSGLCNSCVIGRCANRISNASYVYKNHRVHLEANLNQHCIHGGSGCYAGKNFSFDIAREQDAIRLHLSVLDCGQGGFPGLLSFFMDYVVENDRIRVKYQAVPTEDTPWNVTSHAYFDLNGQGSGAAQKQMLQINADAFLPTSVDGVPTGEQRKVACTDFDFRMPRLLEEALKGKDDQLTQFGGFDHNFCLNGKGFRQAAVLQGLESGISMEVWTDMPGLQLFTLNAAPPLLEGKDGKFYSPHDAVCLETQFYPNAVNHPEWPSSIIPGGRISRTETMFLFH